jgi:hypothetical protein
MFTVTFYSYKGGAGRSLLLSNIAWFAALAGRRVVAIDFDLEAPGLGYKFFPDGAAPRSAGLVGYLLDAQTCPEGEQPDLDDYLVEVPAEGGGSIHLMPAGRAPSANYFHDLHRLHLDNLLDHGVGLDLLTTLQDRLRDEWHADLLLIDARTGITSTNAVTTQVMADAVVALSLDLPEQVDGTTTVLRSLQGLSSLRTGEPIPLHLALSRVPHDGRVWDVTDTDRARLDRVRAVVEAPAQPVTKTVHLASAHVLHHEATLLNGEPVLANRSGPWTRSVLHHDYVRLVDAVFGREIAADVEQHRGPLADSFDAREHLAHLIGSIDLASAVRTERLSMLEGESLQSLDERIATLRGDTGTDTSTRAELADALVELGKKLNAIGDRADAVAAFEAGIHNYRIIALKNPGWRESLAGALVLLSVHSDPAQAAVDHADEATHILRELSATDKTKHLHLAGALIARGTIYMQLGRYQEAFTPAEEAAQLLRYSANPVHLNLHAASLRVLEAFHLVTGHLVEAKAINEELKALRATMRTN